MHLVVFAVELHECESIMTGMRRRQAFKFELLPRGRQQRDMHRFAGACRYVFNKALALQKTNYEGGGKFIGYVAMATRLTEWRNASETPWLKAAPMHPLQHALRDLERAYQNFFAKRAAFPRFKRKGQRESFRYPDAQQFKLDEVNRRIFLPKLGWMRLRLSRPVLGALKNATVSCSAGRWFVSVQTEREVEPSVPTATTAIGIDVGIDRFATLSDGTFYAPLHSFRKHEARLRRYQRAMSRKQKFSNNWLKAKRRVQATHARIGNARRDYLHKATTAISQEHALVCVEDLQVRNLSKSAAGTIEKPGRNVRAKSGLNKSVLDQGWFEFRRQLDYKVGWQGGILVAVPPQYTSQTCPRCAHVSAANRATRAQFRCQACAYENHADVVGAMNILARGHRVAVCGEDGSGLELKLRAKPASVKQEPTEATIREVTHA
jgi:putative transposase